MTDDTPVTWNGECETQLRQAMRSVADGDTGAFRVIAEALDPRLLRFFAQLGVPEAERDDLFQETCVRLYRAAASYDPKRPFLPWAITVARRVMLNWHRSRKPTVALEEADTVPAQQPPPSAGAESDLWAYARSRLTETDYELLWLRYGEDLEPAEIAVVTHRTSVHVRVLLHRARAALAKVLENEGAARKTKRGAS